MGSQVVVVMGGSSSGKPTVGRPLADLLGVAFAEARRLPAANIANLSAARPLDGEDGGPGCAPSPAGSTSTRTPAW